MWRTCIHASTSSWKLFPILHSSFQGPGHRSHLFRLTQCLNVLNFWSAAAADNITVPKRRMKLHLLFGTTAGPREFKKYQEEEYTAWCCEPTPSIYKVDNFHLYQNAPEIPDAFIMNAVTRSLSLLFSCTHTQPAVQTLLRHSIWRQPVAEPGSICEVSPGISLAAW